AQTLFAIERLGRILADDGHGPGRARRLEEYGQSVLRELAWVDEITGTCFACFDRFEIMVTVSMLYFVAAIYCEERECAGQASPETAFLLADADTYRAIAARVVRAAPGVPAAAAGRFAADFCQAVLPYLRAGLCDPARRNMYPYLAST